MYPLVQASQVQGRPASPDDDVAQRHGHCAVGEQGAVFEESRHQPTVDFDYATYELNASAAHERDGHEEQPDGRGR